MIVFFDDKCGVCKGSVKLLKKLDKRSRMRYISLFSEEARTLFQDDYSRYLEMDTVIFVKDGHIRTRSDAVLSILVSFGGLYRIFAVFYLLPSGIRNKLYRFIARNRMLFGRSADHCHYPGKS